MPGQQPRFGQLEQVASSGLPGHPQILLQEFDPGIGMGEQIVEQVLRIDLAVLTAVSATALWFESMIEPNISRGYVKKFGFL